MAQPATKPILRTAGPPSASGSVPQPAAKTGDGQNEPAKKRGRKPGSTLPAYNLEGFAPEKLAQPLSVSEEIALKAAPTRARDDRQVAMDKVVERVHNDWAQLGKPSTWAKMPKVRYVVNPEQVEGLKYLIRRACDFLHVRPKWGTPVTGPDGRVHVVFSVVDKRPREPKNEDNK